MRFVFAFSLFMVIQFQFAVGQNIDWVKLGKNGSVEIFKIKPDANDDIIVLGRYIQKGYFAGFPLKEYKSMAGFIAKLSKTDGKIIWIKTAGDTSGNGFVEFWNVEIGKDGSVFFSGDCWSDNWMDNIPMKSRQNKQDMFIGKLDKNGNVKYIKNFLIYSISNNVCTFTIDDKENFYLIGSIRGAETISNDKFSYVNTSSHESGFVVKFDSAANLSWITTDSVQYLQNKIVDHIRVASNGQIYTTRHDHNFLYISKYDIYGKLIKAIKIKGDKFSSNLNLVLDEENSMYVSGDIYSDSEVIFAGKKYTINSGSLFLLKTDSSLNEKWFITNKSQLHYQGNLSRTYSLFYDSINRQVILSGVFLKALEFSNDKNLYLSKQDSAGIYVASFDKQGKLTDIKIGKRQDYNTRQTIVKDNCGNLIASFNNLISDDVAFLGFDAIAQPVYKHFSTSVIKFSSDTAKFIRFNNDINCNQILLKSQFDTGYKQIYWFVDNQLIDSNKQVFDYKFSKPGKYIVALLGIRPNGCQYTFADTFFINIRNTFEGEPEMLRATFTNNNQVEISWKKHPLAKNYTLYKQHENSEIQTLQKHFSDTAYMDHAVSLKEPFHYYFTATDSCGNISAQSTIAKPIILHGENVENKYILLSGTTYEKWENGVWENVLEMKNEQDSFMAIANSPQTNYQDSLRTKDNILQQCYRLKAVENNGNKQHSYSNLVFVDHLPQIFIPDAFSPNGDSLNERFTIYTTGIKEYTVKVYNRWGEMVFSGNNKSASWDGRFNKSICPEGDYIYILQAKSSTGENFSRSGNIHIIR